MNAWRSLAGTTVPTLLAITGLAIGSCSDEQIEQPSWPAAKMSAASAADVSALASGNSAFALALYEELRGEPGNVFISPYSMSTALAMTYAGARGETEAQMAQALRFDLPPASLHPAFGHLSDSLEQAQNSDTQLSIANRLWAEPRFVPLPEFQSVIEGAYAGGFETVDFSDADGAAEIINGWVEDQTQQKIKDLFLPDDLVEATLVLTNAIYFKSDWQVQFDPEDTREGLFYVSPDESTAVQMMQCQDMFPARFSEDVQILELPYVGERLSMVLLLPNERDGLADLEAQLNAGNLNTWLGELREQDVRVVLPKFKLEQKYLMNEALADLGMPIAFTHGADFSGIDGSNNLFIDLVVHKTYIDVDEQGTEAAAATGIVMKRASIGSIFHADHPFLFLIRDRETNSILFMGRVTNPAR